MLRVGIIACAFWSISTGVAFASGETARSAESSLAYLRQVMDADHTRFPVYDDVSSPGNHFHAYAKVPDENAPATMNGSWTDHPHSGATAIRAEFEPTPTRRFGGFYLQNGTLTGTQTAPQPNFGTVPVAGIDLAGAMTLTFWARGERGGERIDFFVAGVGRHHITGARLERYPDSSPRTPPYGNVMTLTLDWKKFSIDVSSRNLTYVLGGFAWVANDSDNPRGAVFYLDDIQFELSPDARAERLEQPRFLRSFTPLPAQPDPFDDVQDGDIDFVLRNLAFTYDNALAILAFLADGSPDGTRRARLIADAFVYATQNDRTYNDNRSCSERVEPLGINGPRVRTAYAAGDLKLPPGWEPKGRVGTVPIPGFYAEETKMFYEVEQQALDVGNNAWALIALLAVYRVAPEARYLDTACKIANFIDAFRDEEGRYGGFTGGVDGPESPHPKLRPWASVEHNLDVYAAFTVLYELTRDERWHSGAEHAREFVESMWDADRRCYLAGTTGPDERNTAVGTLPLDVQAWSGLSLRQDRALPCAEANHLTAADGATGFDFNDDRDGVWLEGTAQMATAYLFSGDVAKAERYRGELRKVQAANADGALPASSHDGLSTGFTTPGGYVFKYFRRSHVGATSWNVFAQLGFNPYYSQRAVRRRAAGQ